MIENGPTFGTWIAYGVISLFLLALLLLFLRTAFLASTLLFMPVVRAVRAMLPGRRAASELVGDAGRERR